MSSEIAKLIDEITANQNEKGHPIFWDKNRLFKPNELTVGEALCMAAGELAGEAMEAYRDNDKKQFALELADAFLRICHLAGATEIDLVAALKERMAKNKTRPFKHGRALF